MENDYKALITNEKEFNEYKNIQCPCKIIPASLSQNCGTLNPVVRLEHDIAVNKDAKKIYNMLRNRTILTQLSMLHSIFVCVTVSFFILIAFMNLRQLSKEKEVTDGKVYSYSFNGKQEKNHWPQPPPHQDLAAVARYVMHISEWGSLSTFSTHKGIEGYPFVNVFSVSDGPIGNCTGIPYFYLTPLELSVKDIEVDARASLTVTEAQSSYCNTNGFDPEDPRCAHIIFTGKIKKVKKGSAEEDFARYALFSRHDEMKDWPPGHNWFFAKLEITHIYILDYFGGAGVVDPEDYFATNPFKK